MKISDLHWIAGFIEGDGSFAMQGKNRSTVNVQINQVQRWPLEKLIELVGGYIGNTTQIGGFANSQPYYRWAISGYKGAGLMMTIYSLMSPKRKAQIKENLKIWRSRPARIKAT